MGNDELWATLVSFLIVLVVCVLPSVVYVTLKRRKARQALSGSMDSEACVSCGSRRIDHPGLDITRCLECGYEGGKGVERDYAERRIAAFRAVPSKQRLDEAREELELASVHLRDAMSFARENPHLVINLEDCLVGGGGQHGAKSHFEDLRDQLIDEVNNMMKALQGAADRIASLVSAEVPSGINLEALKLDAVLDALNQAWTKGGRASELFTALAQAQVEIERRISLLPQDGASFHE